MIKIKRRQPTLTLDELIKFAEDDEEGVFRISPPNDDYFYGLAIIANKLMLYANKNKIERLNLTNRFYERYSFVKQESSIKDLFKNYNGKFLINGDNFNKETNINLLIDPALGEIIEAKDMAGFNMLVKEWYNRLSLVID